MVCLESIHTLTDIYRSCTDAARQMHALFRVVGSLLRRSQLASQGTSRSLITQCHSLPLLVGRARQDTAPTVMNSRGIVPSHMTQITVAVLLRSSFLLILPSFSPLNFLSLTGRFVPARHAQAVPCVLPPLHCGRKRVPGVLHFRKVEI